MKLAYVTLPETPKECHLSKWEPYPPIIEKIGDYYCKRDKKICDLSEKGCRFMHVVDENDRAT